MGDETKSLVDQYVTRRDALVEEMRKGAEVEADLIAKLNTVRDQVKRIQGAKILLDELIRDQQPDKAVQEVKN